MSVREGIWCECGRRITIHDVLQHGFVMTRWVPRFVFVRYRCSRCRNTAQEVVDFARWDPSVLDAPEVEPTPDEWERFDDLGEITPREVAEFGRLLRSVGAASIRRASREE